MAINVDASRYRKTHQRGTLSSVSLKVFADADYAFKATDKQSLSGGLTMCGGASVCWFSRIQKCVTLSTSEAEYVALGDAVKKSLFLRHILSFILPSKIMPCFPVFEDNRGAVKNLRRTRSRTQIRSTLTYVTIFFETLSANGILK